MPKLVKVYSEEELRRQVHFVLQEHQVPGLLRFLASLPYGAEGAWWRGVAALWLQEHAQDPDLQARIDEALAADGGDINLPRASRKQRAPGKKAVTRQKAVHRSLQQASPPPLPKVPALPVAAHQAVTGGAAEIPPAMEPLQDMTEQEQAFLDEFENLSV